MSEPSDHSAELAAQLRETALKNLGRAGKTYRSTISGKFVSGSSSKRHPHTTTTENSGSGSSAAVTEPRSRSSVTGRFIWRSGKS